MIDPPELRDPLIKGKTLFKEGKYKLAEIEFLTAAKLGSPEACEYLGLIYETGSSDVERNLSEALKYFKFAAEKNRIGGYEGLGRFYYFGWGIERNFKLAHDYYSRIEKCGVLTAPVCLMLGRMYQFGRGVEINLVKASDYYKMASEKGNVFGEKFLGMLLVQQGEFLIGWYHRVRAPIRAFFISMKNKNDVRLYSH